MTTWRGASRAVIALALVLSSCSSDTPGGSGGATPAPTAAASPAVSEQNALATATPIKHLVVIFQENVSFDHYFGTYPQAANPAGQPVFTAAAETPWVNGYLANTTLLTNNPNTTSAANLKTSVAPELMNPFRIDRAQADTTSQNHNYLAEQLASNNGRMDSFVAYTGRSNQTKPGSGAFGTAAQVMAYFDGNTVTALWNYAQNFAMSDNAYTDTFGPSTPGALHVVAGTNAGATQGTGTVADGQGGWTVIGDPEPAGDVCTKDRTPVSLAGKNIGDLLNAAGITWGGFMGGFDLTAHNPDMTTGCRRSMTSPITSRSVVDYKPHHAWFQYFASTANLKHTRPSSVAMIGHTEPTLDAAGSATPVHHQYDLNDFIAAVKAGNFPSVSYLKAQAIGDGHPGNSNPLDEQTFLVNTLNFLQQQPDWKSTAVLILYDDSDGWYDHRSPNILTSSFDATVDQMTAPGKCDGLGAVQGVGLTGKPVNGRCGPGSRIPFLVISPWSRVNYVDSTPITQSSVLRFIEYNWLKDARIGGGSNDANAGKILNMFDFTNAPHLTPLFLDPTTGTKVAAAPAM